MLYLSPTTTIPEQYADAFGVMFSACHPVGGLNDALECGWQWMMDNNQFSNKFTAEIWLRALLKYRKYSATCLGIPIPDMVGDALETLRMFSNYHKIVSDLGFPVAFVTQDGITPEIAPWDWFNVLFVGGTDDHKLGAEAMVMIAEAIGRGKRVHVGRVNSPERVQMFHMADSVDGTNLIKEKHGRKNKKDKRTFETEVKKYALAVRYCNNKKSGRLGVNGQAKILEVLN